MAFTPPLDELSQCLQAAGLHPVEPWGPYDGWADLVIFGRPFDPQAPILTFPAPGLIANRQGEWIFTIMGDINGPGAEGLEYKAATFEDIKQITLQYFLGEPHIIAGWSVPIHRHPEWQRDRLHQAIAQADSLPREAWQRYRHDAREQYHRLIHESHPRLTLHPRSIAWEEWYACLFVQIDQCDPTHEAVLWLRRDLQAAYIVSTHENAS